MDIGMTVNSHTEKPLLGSHPHVQRPITLAAGQNLARGCVLGRITESGLYVGFDADLDNGAENAVAILAEATDASSVDAPTIAYFHGQFVETGLVWIDEANDKATGLAALNSVGIFTIKSY